MSRFKMHSLPVGRKSGLLEVVGSLKTERSYKYACECRCGRTILNVRHDKLAKRIIKSCGCGETRKTKEKERDVIKVSFIDNWIQSRPWRLVMKPLFIPLKTEYFNAFKEGNKQEELRKFGPRWNYNTCLPGRAVVLSKGYGKNERLKGVIWGFECRYGYDFKPDQQEDINAVFGTLDIDIARISIEILK